MKVSNMKKEIILISNNQSIQQIISSYLGEEFEFYYYNDKEISISELKSLEISPKLFLIDLKRSPDKIYKLVQEIKSDPMLKKTPSIVLSNSEEASLKIYFFRNGVNDYILKPFNPLELKTRIKRLIN